MCANAFVYRTHTNELWEKRTWKKCFYFNRCLFVSTICLRQFGIIDFFFSFRWIFRFLPEVELANGRLTTSMLFFEFQMMYFLSITAIKSWAIINKTNITEIIFVRLFFSRSFFLSLKWQSDQKVIIFKFGHWLALSLIFK